MYKGYFPFRYKALCDLGEDLDKRTIVLFSRSKAAQKISIYHSIGKPLPRYQHIHNKVKHARFYVNECVAYECFMYVCPGSYKISKK